MVVHGGLGERRWISIVGERGVVRSEEVYIGETTMDGGNLFFKKKYIFILVDALVFLFCMSPTLLIIN